MALTIHSPTHDAGSTVRLYRGRSGVIRQAAGRARSKASLDYHAPESEPKSPYKTTRMSAWMSGLTK